MTDDVRKLLGGYATGTLTEDEKKVLFEAALHDDALFAALADEQTLKDLLDDSAVRARLLQATEEPRFSVLAALREWFEQPKSKALAATGAVLLAIIGFNQVRQVRNEPPQTVAELRHPAPASTPLRQPDSPSLSVYATPKNKPNSTAPQPTASRRTSTPAPLADAEVKAEPAPPKSEQPAQLREKDEPVAQPTEVARPAAPAAPVEKAVEAPESRAVAGAAPGRTLGGVTGTRAAALRSPNPQPAADAAQSFASGAFQRAAGTSVTPLRYELLRRDTTGNFQAVPADYLFSPGDTIRLRVTSSRDGAVGVSSNASGATVSRTIVANTWTEVPQSGAIPITADTARLIVAFSPSEVLSGNILETSEARAKRTATPAVSLEIPIRQKKP